MTFILVAFYVVAIVAANLLVAMFGPAVTPINAFLFIGFDLAVRNWLGIKFSPTKMLGLIAFAGVASYLVNPVSGIIAIASVTAFVLSALADWLTFKYAKGTWLARSMRGVTVGAAVDSVVFPTIAFGGLMPLIVAAQFAAKVAGGFLWSYVISKVAK